MEKLLSHIKNNTFLVLLFATTIVFSVAFQFAAGHGFIFESLYTPSFLMKGIALLILGTSFVFLLNSITFYFSNKVDTVLLLGVLLSIVAGIDCYVFYVDFESVQKFEPVKWLLLHSLNFGLLCIFVNISGKIKRKKKGIARVDYLVIFITALTFSALSLHHLLFNSTTGAKYLAKFDLNHWSFYAGIFVFLFYSCYLTRKNFKREHKPLNFSMFLVSVLQLIFCASLFAESILLKNNTFYFSYSLVLFAYIFPVVGLQLQFLTYKKEDELRFLELISENKINKKITEDLQGNVDQAEADSQTKSAFLANMSHELRTPLNAIIGYSEMLMEEAEEEESNSNYEDLNKINRSGKHLLRLINDVLDLSKIEAGKVELAPEMVFLKDFFDEVVSTIRPMATRNGNKINLEYGNNVELIQNDKTKMRQCLLNILSNSSKFTENGNITINVNPTTIEGVEAFQIEVTDTGVGMTPSQVEKIFQSFVQVDNSATKRFEGTGLGLTITKKIIELMGGRIEVESKLGEGTIFRVRIPTKVEAVVEGEEAKPQEIINPDVEASWSKFDASAKKTRKVIFIDNDEAFCASSAKILESFGFAVTTAFNGLDGIQLAEMILPDVIILDVRMPNMDGWKVLSLIQEIEQLKTIPVIMMTANFNPQKVADNNASDFVVKPFEFELLAEKIEKQILGEVQAGKVLIFSQEESFRKTLELGMKHFEASYATVSQIDNLWVENHVLFNDIFILDLRDIEFKAGVAIIEKVKALKEGVDVNLVVICAKTLKLQEISKLHKHADVVLCEGEFSIQKDILTVIAEYLKQKSNEVKNLDLDSDDDAA